MRTFVAADLPQEMLPKIDKIVAYFKTQTPSGAVKWVDTQNLHLTIKFIGDLQEEKLEQAKSLMEQALNTFPPLSIAVEELGIFPDACQPRIIWLGIKPAEKLIEIHNVLDQVFAEIGIKREKRDFHPHLTLGRVRRHVDRDTVQEIGKTFSKFRVDALGLVYIKEIHLFQSELTRQGPIYTSLCVVPLHQV